MKWYEKIVYEFGFMINNAPVYGNKLVNWAVRREHVRKQREVQVVSPNLEAAVGLLRRVVDELSVIDESEGIAGYHLNGEISTWNEGTLPELRDEIESFLERVTDRTYLFVTENQPPTKETLDGT